MDKDTKETLKKAGKSAAKIGLASVLFPPAAPFIAAGEFVKHAVGAVGGEKMGKAAKVLFSPMPDVDDLADKD